MGQIDVEDRNLFRADRFRQAATIRNEFLVNTQNRRQCWPDDRKAVTSGFFSKQVRKTG
jgi:hypothetical protein